MVKNAARVLKIGVLLRFDPKFTVEFEHFDQKYFRQAYLTLGQAKFFGGFLSQTPLLSLTQTVTPYKFLGPYGIVLPRLESFEVCYFMAYIEIKWPTSKLLWRGKMMS